jgi:hypothetical protein
MTLSEVELVAADKHAPSHLRLTGKYAGNVYRTSLGVVDAALLLALFQLLAKRVGQTIAVIGAQLVDRSLKPLPTRPAA